MAYTRGSKSCALVPGIPRQAQTAKKNKKYAAIAVLDISKGGIHKIDANKTNREMSVRGFIAL
jgi:hypothetical protein